MLYEFQKDGVKGAINKILRHNGCIIADSVGLVNPMGSAVKNGFTAFEAAGGAGKYVPMLSDFVAEANGLKREE